jgi:hypothetical protein
MLVYSGVDMVGICRNIYIRIVINIFIYALFIV